MWSIIVSLPPLFHQWRTLINRDSYMDYLKAAIKQDTLIALRNSQLHTSSLFLDHLLAKVEEEIFHLEQKHFSEDTCLLPTLLSVWQAGTESPVYWHGNS